VQAPQLSPAELAELMRKARGEDEEEPPTPVEDADRMKGLGFRPCVLHSNWLSDDARDKHRSTLHITSA